MKLNTCPTCQGVGTPTPYASYFNPCETCAGEGNTGLFIVCSECLDHFHPSDGDLVLSSKKTLGFFFLCANCEAEKISEARA